VAGGLGWLGYGCCGTCNVIICVTSSSCVTGSAVPGATVTIKNGSTVIASGMTDGTGCVTLAIGSAGTYTVVVSATGWQTQTQTETLGCGSTTTISLGAVDPLYQCCGGFAFPIPKTIYWTACGQTYTLIFNSILAEWGPTSGNITTAGVCVVPGACSVVTSVGTGVTNITIAVQCPAGGSTTTLHGSESGCIVGVFGLAPNGTPCVCNMDIPWVTTAFGTGGSGVIVLTGTLYPTFSLTGTMPAVDLTFGSPAPCAGQGITLTS